MERSFKNEPLRWMERAFAFGKSTRATLICVHPCSSVVKVFFVVKHSSMAETAPRLISLDVFRGMTIAGMVLVNNPGTWSHIYDPLEHAAWHGLTPTDWIFPFFLFIVGIAIVNET